MSKEIDSKSLREKIIEHRLLASLIIIFFAILIVGIISQDNILPPIILLIVWLILFSYGLYGEFKNKKWEWGD